MIWFINIKDGALVGAISDDGPQYDASPLHVRQPPPECGAGYWPRWVDGAWSCAVDMRGSAWHQPGTQSMIVITKLGDEPPPGWVQGPPQSGN